MPFDPTPLAEVINPPSVVDKAKQLYSYLRDANISYAQGRPSDANGRKLEYWAPGDMGWDWNGKWYERPLGTPKDAHVVQVFDQKGVRPIDVLGDYVSHHAVDADQKLKALYEQFKASVPEATMQERYKYHQQHLNEQRPFADWVQQSGMPEYFRGYTFDQWGPNAKAHYAPQQLQVLDQIRQYLGIK